MYPSHFATHPFSFCNVSILESGGEGGGWLDSIDVLYLFIYSVPHPSTATTRVYTYIHVSGETKLYRFHFQAH